MEITSLKNRQPGLSSASLPVFEANQILSSKHLNDLRDFLDQQDRLTRVRLIGQGIVKGFEANLINRAGTGSCVQVGAGLAVTSEGHLIESEQRVLTHYRKYNDPTDYDLFYDTIGLQKSQVNLWELIEEDYIDEDEAHLYTPVEGNTSILFDKTLLIFLEIFDEDQKSCFTFSCDGKGLKRVFNIRLLLIENNVMDKWLQNQFNVENSVQLEGFVNNHLRISEAKLKRIKLYSAKKPININNYQKLALLYKNTIEEFVSDYDEVVAKLNDTLLLRFPNLNKISKVSSFFQNLLTTNYLNVQYIYSLCSDLNSTLNRIIYLVKIFLKDFTLAEEVFPNHIMLGNLITENVNTCENNVYRNYFKYTSANLYGQDLLDEISFYIEKIRLMQANFELNLNTANKIKITPALEGHYNEESITVPFYYQPVVEQEMLYKYWNYELYKTCCFDRVLSYWAEDYASLQFIKNPLEYSINKFGFLRIEGHIGKNLDSVEEFIEDLRIDNNLPFKFISLSLKPEVNLADMNDDFNFDFFTRKKNVNKKSFSNFLKKHTGLEHKGGVSKGGTFILVYEENVNDKELTATVVADFSLPYMVDLTEPVIKKEGDYSNDYNNDFSLNE